MERLVTRREAAVRWFVLDAEAICDIDTTGAEVMHQVFAMLSQRDITIAVTRANPQIPALLQRYGLLELIGDHRLYPTNRYAVAAFRQESGQSVCELSAAQANAAD